MKLCMFTPRAAALERGWPGRIEGDRVIQLAAQTLQAFFSGGGSAREHAAYPLADVEFRAPVLLPPSVRLFAGASLEFAFANPAAIVGPGDEIPCPAGEDALEFGAGLAAVIGADGAIGGYTLAIPWLAPSLPGPKQRDFALAVGPVVVTDRRDWTITSSVGGEVVAEVAVGAAPWDDLVAFAARNTRLRPGDLLVLDFGRSGVALRPGDTVELETDEIGVLANRVVAA
jgi:hypothetical protein